MCRRKRKKYEHENTENEPLYSYKTERKTYVIVYSIQSCVYFGWILHHIIPTYKRNRYVGGIKSEQRKTVIVDGESSGEATP